VAIDHDGRRAVCAAGDGSVKLWDLEDGRTIATFEAGAPIPCCALARGGSTVAVGDIRGRARIWRLSGR